MGGARLLERADDPNQEVVEDVPQRRLPAGNDDEGAQARTGNKLPVANADDPAVLLWTRGRGRDQQAGNPGHVEPELERAPFNPGQLMGGDAPRGGVTRLGQHHPPQPDLVDQLTAHGSSGSTSSSSSSSSLGSSRSSEERSAVTYSTLEASASEVGKTMPTPSTCSTASSLSRCRPRCGKLSLEIG